MGGPKILHVEDDPESRLLVRRVLEAAGYEILEAFDGLTGIEAALRERPALILLDINLPGVDGYTVATALGAFPKLANIPIIAITAYTQPDDRQRMLVAGCDGYIAKPIDVDAFPVAVAEFLRGRRERADAGREGTYLRDLNQRFVDRLMGKLDEVKRLTDHVLERARRLEAIHEAVNDLTSELGVMSVLERLLPKVARALNAADLTAELSDPPGVRLTAGPGGLSRPTEMVTDLEWKYPLATLGRPLGFLMARYLRGAGPTADDEHLFKIVAAHVAIAVENARLYETERRAHADAEAGRARDAFLAQASAKLAASLDFESTLGEVARLAVPDVADLCIVDLVEDDGTIRRSTVSVGDPEKETLAAALRRYPPDTKSLHFVSEEVRTGQARLLTEIPDFLLPALTRDAEHLGVLRALALRSVIVVPLVARGHTLGAITFGVMAANRRYGPADLALAEGLTARAALALDNARLYQEVHEADGRKDLFLTVLAHELRTPLAPIMSAMDIIRRYEGDEPLVRRAREIVDRQVRHQARILDDLLDLARIGHGKIELERTTVDLGRTVTDALDVVRPLFEERGQTVTMSLPPEQLVIAGDATRLAQVMANLLSNAAKYTPTGGEITVSVGSEGVGGEDDRAVVRVRDTGEGIASELLPRIFDPFFQADAFRVDRRPGGLGVGLALVRRLVELHGGSVEARSEGVGRGAEFIVRLPIGHAPTLTDRPSRRRRRLATSS